MERIEECIHDIWDEYIKKTDCHFPRLEVLIDCCDTMETYRADYEDGVIRLIAGSSLVAMYGCYQLAIGVMSGHLGEFLGEHCPKFSLRPLWVVDSGGWLSSGAIDLFCSRVIELGYNSVVFEGLDVLGYVDVIKSYGLKVIAKVSGDEDFSIIKDNAIDYVFCEADFYNDSSDRDATMYELAKREVKALESVFKDIADVIYYLPRVCHRNASWFGSLCDDVAKGTVIAFSAVDGDSHDCYLPPNYVWEALRESVDVSSTPLLPVVNSGKIAHGEGMWPDMSLDLVDKYFDRMHRHNFAGVMILTRHLPAGTGVLHGSLWVAGNAMWSGFPARLLAETWASVYCPKIVSDISVFYDVERIVSTMGILRSMKQDSDEVKAEVSEVLSQLQRLYISYVKNNRGMISDYLSYFIRDIKRIVFHCVKSLRIPVGNILEGDDLGDGFWTAMESNTGKSFGGQINVVFSDVPYSGEDGSSQKAIYMENTGYIEASLCKY